MTSSENRQLVLIDRPMGPVEEAIAEGLENCPATLRGLFEGADFGKQLLKVKD